MLGGLLGSFGGELLDFAGGLISQRSRRKDATKNRRMAQAQFDAQMDQTIQRRVADAKAAGIHPLYALGASSGASPTMGHSVSGMTGSAVGDAISRIGARLAEAQLSKTRADAKKSEAEAQLADSKTATVTSRLASSGRDGVRTYAYPEEPEMEMAYGPGWVEDPARTIATKRPGVEATPSVPSYVEFQRADGSTGLAFGSSIPGAEDLNQVWIPLQNWWHTSKVARARIRKALGITDSDYMRMRRNAREAEAFVRRNKRRIQTLKRELRNFNKAASGRPVR